MLKYLLAIKDRILVSLNLIWSTKRGRISASVVLIIVYTGLSLIAGEPLNPALIAWWCLIGCLAAALLVAICQKHVDQLKLQLDEKLSNPPGFSYFVSTIDGARIGDLDESTYLKAKHKADICCVTKSLRLLNILWVLWMVLAKTLSFMPVLLITAVLAYQLFGSDHSLSEVTLGQFLESSMLITAFKISFIFILAASFKRGLRHAPGYKNFYELRLRRLLSEELPNIANANGFTITGYKIDWDATTAEISK